MTKGVIYCQDDDAVADALDIMGTRNIHHLLVRNSSNTLVGMLSLSDLALKGPSEYHADVARLAFGSASTGQATATTQLR